MHLLALVAVLVLVLLAVAAGVLLAERRLLRAGLPRLTAVLVRNPEALASEKDGETILSLPGRAEGLALNKVAARCWELTDGAHTIWRIGRSISLEHRLPLREALREVRTLSRQLKSAFLAMEPAEWDLVHLHRDGLFSGARSADVVEVVEEDGLIVHAALCIQGTDAAIRPWLGTRSERRAGAEAMKAHCSGETVLEEAAREFKKGWDLCAAGRLDQAEAAFARSAARAPRWANAHYQLGYVSLRLRKFAEAIGHLERAESLSPGFYMVREYLDQARRLASGDLSHEAFLLFDRANASGLRDPDRTIRLVRQALEISPDFPSARLILARAYEKKELLHMALEELSQTIKMNPDPATLCHALLSRGAIFMAQGRANQAVREWTQVIRIDGSATATRGALASLAHAEFVH